MEVTVSNTAYHIPSENRTTSIHSAPTRCHFLEHTTGRVVELVDLVDRFGTNAFRLKECYVCWKDTKHEIQFGLMEAHVALGIRDIKESLTRITGVFSAKT